MKKTDYLNLEEALFIHAVSLKRFGGTSGIRDLGALESALYRPQTGYYKDVIEEAAALMESLAINHPFLDGNKRVSFAITHIFLKINGYEIEVSPEVAIKKIDQLFDTNKFEYAEIEKWLRKHSRSLSKSD